MPISIARGENRGREVTYHNVVRNVLKVGDWNGNPGSWSVPLENISSDGVDAAALEPRDALVGFRGGGAVVDHQGVATFGERLGHRRADPAFAAASNESDLVHDGCPATRRVLYV